MRARDIMTTGVISVSSDTPLIRAAEMMLQYDISGFPVVESGKLVGIVTEGDFLRRAETGTQRRPPRSVELLLGPGRLAEDYVQAHGRKVGQVMSREVVTVAEDAPLEHVAEVMEVHSIRRVPVVRGSCVIGIVSRRDLVRAFAAQAKKARPVAGGDAAIREQLLNELDQEGWVPRDRVEVSVQDGVVELCGAVADERQRQGIRVLAENVPGVREVHDRLVPADGGAGS